MHADGNMVSELSSDLLNKGFALLDNLFKKHGWRLVKNELNWIHYTKFGDETSYFDIKILIDKILVSIPVKNSPFQYNTSFKNYYDASEYIEQRLLDYVQ